ncbi:Xaa-Pro dipeptidase, partial [Tremellales sp. Uapishka_1]
MSPQRYPARLHAQKLAVELGNLLSSEEKGCTHAVLLQASPSTCRDDTDREMLFHQEANFNYLTGCLIPSAIVLLLFTFPEMSSLPPKIQHTLLIPPADPVETMWSVAPPTLEEARAMYDSDSFQHTTALPQLLAAATSSSDGQSSTQVTIHTLPLTMEYPPLPHILDTLQRSKIRTSAEHLLKALHIARLVKTESEIDLIREACRISSGAHEVLMMELGRYASLRAEKKIEKKARDGKEGVREWEVESEGDAEALFVASCRRQGAINMAYLPIVASGSRASTLHYVCNDRLFPSTSIPRQAGDTSFSPQAPSRGCCGSAPEHEHASPTSEYHSAAFQPQLLLIDAGCEWKGYAADVTRTIPIGNGGKYTERGREIYDLVLRMQKECEEITVAGKHWDEIHLHAHKVLIEGFLKLGLFKGDKDAILQSGISAAFYPHGLGHSLGLDVHDSRQYLKTTFLDLPESTAKTPSKLYAYLRIRQVLVENMVLTIEPGCYFAPQLLTEHGVYESEFVDQKVLESYEGIGGVRIEDVVVVKKGACENLTTVGRDTAWVEKTCSGSD